MSQQKLIIQLQQQLLEIDVAMVTAAAQELQMLQALRISISAQLYQQQKAPHRVHPSQ